MAKVSMNRVVGRPKLGILKLCIKLTREKATTQKLSISRLGIRCIEILRRLLLNISMRRFWWKLFIFKPRDTHTGVNPRFAGDRRTC